MFKEIILTAVGNNIKAQLKEKTTAWACEKNANEAIGQLIYAHREEFGISIRFDHDDKATRKYLEEMSQRDKDLNCEAENLTRAQMKSVAS